MIDIAITPERFAALAPAIQQKILRAKQAAERRQAKKEDREALKSWLRLQELQSIPVKQRTKDEHNEFQRLYRQQKRRADKGEQTAVERVDERIRSKEAFWELNRASLTAKIPAWRERQETVLDTLAWFDRLDAGTETPENCGENYLSALEGLQDVLDDIDQFGVAHMGYVYHNPNIPVDWSDGHYSGRAFYKNEEVYRLLCQENQPTAIYVKTGILVSLPDWKAVDYIRRHCGWKDEDAQRAVGRKYRGITLTYGDFSHGE